MPSVTRPLRSLLSLNATKLRLSDQNRLGLTGEAPSIDKDLELVHIRPPTENNGLATGPRYVDDLHDDPKAIDGTPPRYTFELWRHGGVFDFVLGTHPRNVDDLIDDTRANYRDVATEQFSGNNRDVWPLPDVSNGQSLYAAGARMDLQKDCSYPLRTIQTKGDPLSRDDDPYRSILSAMTDDSSDVAVMQVVFEPTSSGWYYRGSVGDTTTKKAAYRRQQKPVGIEKTGSKGNRRAKVKKVPASSSDKNTASDMERQSGRDSFIATIRVFAFSTSRRRASKRARKMSSMFSTLNHSDGKQKLVPKNGLLTGNALKAELARAIMRRIPSESRTKKLVCGPSNALIDEELGTLVRFPAAEDVDGPDISWSRQTSGAGVPAGAVDPRLETQQVEAED